MTVVIIAALLAALLAFCGSGLRDKARNIEQEKKTDRPVEIDDLETFEDFDNVDEEAGVIGWE